MANLTISHEDLAAVMQAQRNEGWDAAAKAGAALQAASRQIDALEKELAELKAKPVAEAATA